MELLTSLVLRVKKEGEHNGGRDRHACFGAYAAFAWRSLIPMYFCMVFPSMSFWCAWAAVTLFLRCRFRGSVRDIVPARFRFHAQRAWARSLLISVLSSGQLVAAEAACLPGFAVPDLSGLYPTLMSMQPAMQALCKVAIAGQHISVTTCAAWMLCRR